MTAYTTATHDDDEGGAEGIEAGGCEKDSIAGELFEDELVVKVTGLGAASEGFGAEVFFVGGGDRAERGKLFSGRKLSVISVSYLNYSWMKWRQRSERCVQEADLLERMIVTQVRYRVFESGDALLV